MEIEITAHAPTMDSALDFLEAVQVARRPTADEIAQGAPAHIPIPVADVLIDGFRDPIAVMDSEGNPVPGFHYNLRFYGASEVTLAKPVPAEGWGPDADLFDKTYINELVAGRLGEIPNWTASAEDPVPPGYVAGENRAYDPALIANRRRVWA